jgi:hypothetical protein
MSNATAENRTLTTGLQAMQFARGFLKTLLESTPDNVFYTVPVAGGNHAAWVVGHLAVTDDFVLSALSGRQSMLPKEWGELFNGGTICHPDASRYPTRQELEQKLHETRAALEAWYTSLSEEQLATVVQGDLAMFIPTWSAIGGACGFHDAFHSAQISVARRASGMPPLF